MRRSPATSPDGVLYGRGAVDMKGAIACKVAAALDHLAAHGGKPKGSISFLITGDEEGVAVNGTVKLLKWAAARGEKFDHCVLGEPGNVAELGDTIKIGRRGSQNGVLVVTGKQGHVAYPHRADNPVRGLVKLMSALMDEPLDQGSAQFDPSNLEFTSIDIGNPTVNLIPGEARARFNIRFNDCHNYASLKALVEQRAGARPPAARCAGGSTGSRRTPTCSSPSPSPFTDVVIGAVAEVTGRKPSSRPPAAPRTRASSRTIARWWSSAWSAPPCTPPTSACRSPTLQTLTAVYRKILDKYFG